jgi:hypothetical protein
MKEANIQSLFGKWLKEHWSQSAVFELKLEKGKAFRLDRLAQHQREGLLEAKNGGIYHKISDSLPIFGGNKHMRFTSKKPFDCLYINSPAYVAICFYMPRKYKKLLLIPIQDFLLFEGNHERKSARLEELMEITEQLIEL